MGSWQVKKLITTTIMVVVLLGFVSPIMGIDHPVEPFQKAKALVLEEGKTYEGKTGKIYMFVIKGWGSIMHSPSVVSQKYVDKVF